MWQGIRTKEHHSLWKWAAVRRHFSSISRWNHWLRQFQGTGVQSGFSKHLIRNMGADKYSRQDGKNPKGTSVLLSTYNNQVNLIVNADLLAVGRWISPRAFLLPHLPYCVSGRRGKYSQDRTHILQWKTVHMWFRKMHYNGGRFELEVWIWTKGVSSYTYCTLFLNFQVWLVQGLSE